MPFTSHNKGLEAFFIAISQRRQQVASATRSRVVYGIYAYSKIIVIDLTNSNTCNLVTDTPIREIKISLNREQIGYLSGNKKLNFENFR